MAEGGDFGYEDKVLENDLTTMMMNKRLTEPTLLSLSRRPLQNLAVRQ